MGDIRNYLQLGLPLGNALLIVALVELVITKHQNTHKSKLKYITKFLIF